MPCISLTLCFPVHGQIGSLDDIGDAMGGQVCMSGVEFDDLELEARGAAVAKMALFSRVEPSHKTQLVDVLKRQVCPTCLLLHMDLHALAFLLKLLPCVFAGFCHIVLCSTCPATPATYTWSLQLLRVPPCAAMSESIPPARGPADWKMMKPNGEDQLAGHHVMQCAGTCRGYDRRWSQ